MNSILYAALIISFAAGGVGIYFTNKRKEKPERRENWIKYITYFLIINILFSSVVFGKENFSYVCVFIILMGCIEFGNLQKKSNLSSSWFLILAAGYILLSSLFYMYSIRSETNVLIFTLGAVFAFDAFCQISGQLFGRRKLCPKLSPNKTVEGLGGGLFVAIVISCFIGYELKFTLFYSMVLGIGVCLFSLAGDLSASWVKRRYGVKNFSSILPGHGGFLDRFDSLIAAGAFIYLFNLSLGLGVCHQ
ncbi:MAG: phosphatidate cytidylyltransferase [Rhodanobacter sp.]|nr:phosphatidate cytidylyltransferase [Rhodanobacter sp.]